MGSTSVYTAPIFETAQIHHRGRQSARAPCGIRQDPPLLSPLPRSQSNFICKCIPDRLASLIDGRHPKSGEGDRKTGCDSSLLARTLMASRPTASATPFKARTEASRLRRRSALSPMSSAQMAADMKKSNKMSPLFQLVCSKIEEELGYCLARQFPNSLRISMKAERASFATTVLSHGAA